MKIGKSGAKGYSALVSVSINADSEWYEIVMRCLRREDGWMNCGNKCDGSGVVGKVDRVIRVENVMSK